ncbi:MAG: ABC transporter permease [Anaerolineae bacterium]|nr:ABC transporter permease [Anaerolineae bacterium]
MGVIWHKVWRDLAHNKARAALATLSIAVGVFALGLTVGARGVMDVYLAREKEISQPANVIFKGDRLGQGTVEAALREPGVADAELETTTGFRWRLPQETAWRPGVLIAREDYASQRVSRVELLEGSWPTEAALVVERQTARYFGIPLGATIVVEAEHGEAVSIGGVARKPYVLPPQYDGPPTFYATPEVVARLAGVRDPNKFYIRLTPGGESIDVVRERVEDRLVRMGFTVSGFTAAGIEDEFPMDSLGGWLDAIFLVLGVLGVAALGVSAFLIVNTLDAIVVQQVWQIGVMKVLGATLWRLVRVYLATALIYGALALVLAAPLGALGAHAISGWMLETFNIIATGDFQVSPVAVGVQAVMALAVAVSAAAVSVIGGVRVSPHRAISTYGLGGRFGRGPLDRLVGWGRILSRPVALSLRNAFRRKMRVALTLLTFVFVGVLFISVVSTRVSLNSSLEVVLADLAYDVMVISPRAYRTDRLIDTTEEVPGVARAEVWDQAECELSLANGDRVEFMLFGVPPDSQVLRPRLAVGRALLPGDGHAIMVNNRVAAEEGIQVGDVLALTIAGRESTWTVVGLSLTTTPALVNFAPYEVMAREAGHADRGNMVMVVAAAQDAGVQERLATALSDVYAAQRIETATLRSADEFRQMSYAMFDVIFYLLLTMALLAVIVGGVGLTGTLAIGVVERRREIGVMRAIGAHSSAIFRVFVGEGLALGVLSWLLAVPLSYPAARLFGRAVGLALLGADLMDFQFSLFAVGLWLVLVLALSALASVWPALRAVRVSVREALAYE